MEGADRRWLEVGLLDRRSINEAAVATAAEAEAEAEAVAVAGKDDRGRRAVADSSWEVWEKAC